MSDDKIDVLAVMDFRIDQAVSNWRYHGQDDGPEPDSIIVFRQARAAIAELIEAVKGERWAREQGTDIPVITLIRAIERTDAALARVGAMK